MLKSSVYLPDELKAELAALADRWGRSEAELIRIAIDRLVRAAADEPAPAPARQPVPTGPRLVGVGVGPSDPDLVTERAVAVLRSADRVVAAATGPDAIGRAEAVVRSAVPEVAVDRLVIDIGGDAAARRRSVERAAETVLGHLDRGELVAFAVLGDPNVWTIFPRVVAAVTARRPGVPVETVPGIMAFQELAARTGVVLADGDEELTLVTLGGDAERLDPLLADPHRGLVVYKGGRVLPEVAAVLDRRGRLGAAVLGEMLGLPGGRSVPVAAAADRPASYLATVVVPPERAGDGAAAAPTGPAAPTASGAGGTGRGAGRTGGGGEGA
ncbi:MAG TPA: SAM-dependent methyltransferase [Acidimicrobiales bacterium]